MRVWVAVPLAVALLSGCVGLDQPACADVGDPAGTVRTPWVDKGYLQTDAGQGWDTLVLQDGGAEAAAHVHAEGWSVATERLSAWGGGANFSAIRVTPGQGSGQLDLDYRLDACEGGNITWDLDAPRTGDSAQPGQGVHVYTAGFWENGTLFYTNIAAIDRSDWPRASWYAWEGGEPLPVYVYDQSRDEEPPSWRPPSSHVPKTGTPADPALATAGHEADTTTGLGYFTTIPGFNEALKGLSSSTVRVVRLAPEDAYTRPGNEGHDLYGDAIVFYIKVVQVVDLPCPLAAGDLCDVMAMAR